MPCLNIACAGTQLAGLRRLLVTPDILACQQPCLDLLQACCGLEFLILSLPASNAYHKLAFI